MISLNDITLPQLRDVLVQEGIPGYRAGQIFRWFSKGILNIDQMTDLSIELREKLKKTFDVKNMVVERKLISEKDGTIKFLLNCNDKNLVESVFMRYNYGNTVCISSQVGCNMGCSFCASTLGGRVRNLTAGEMLAQVSVIQREVGERVSNIVIMGIGEPLDNFENVMIFLKNINDESGLNIGYRHISLSTCGLVNKIKELAELEIPLTLSVSLHAPNDELRSRIMPINKRHSVNELLETCREYINLLHRRISFEYILIQGVNDLPGHARELAQKIKGMLCHVNLIPVNFVEEIGYQRSTREATKKFLDILTRAGINATVRRELGTDIMAACGQLRRNSS